MLSFTAKVYSVEEAFFNTLKDMYEDETHVVKAMTAFESYLKCRAENNGSEFDFMFDWLEQSKNITDYRLCTAAQINAFGLDSSPWYVDTVNYSEAE